MSTELDHLVVAAASLEAGARWCERVLGVTPLPGGEHPLMGTHNLLLPISTPRFPRTFLEIIAINPAAPDPGRIRWFDLDDAPLRASLARGPRLVHFAARTGDGAATVASLKDLGIDRGPLIAARRATPAGMLHWQISVREDGQRLFDGVLPTLIEWDGPHPADAMPEPVVGLRSLRASHPQAALLQQAFRSIGLGDVDVRAGGAELVAELATPSGRVTLHSAVA